VTPSSALAARHDRLLRWRPIELAKVWEEQGVLEAYKAVRRAKGRYVMRDAARVAGRTRRELRSVSIFA
jgi:2-hydroxychromene-2-carboxylate isomerase